jgi:hypothetical protein
VVHLCVITRALIDLCESEESLKRSCDCLRSWIAGWMERFGAFVIQESDY